MVSRTQYSYYVVLIHAKGIIPYALQSIFVKKKSRKKIYGKGGFESIELRTFHVTGWYMFNSMVSIIEERTTRLIAAELTCSMLDRAKRLDSYYSCFALCSTVTPHMIKPEVNTNIIISLPVFQ